MALLADITEIACRLSICRFYVEASGTVYYSKVAMIECLVCAIVSPAMGIMAGEAEGLFIGKRSIWINRSYGAACDIGR